MKQTTLSGLLYPLIISLITFIFLGLLLTGCATYQPDEESGISGTGNNINCALDKYKKRPECLSE